METRKMYLEISHRYCGKTERLINAALEALLDLEAWYTIHIVTRKEDKWLEQRFWQAFSEKSGLIDLSGKNFKRFRNRVYFDTSYRDNMKKLTHEISCHQGHKTFFDDFEWLGINDLSDSVQNDLIEYGTYWCGTAKKLYHCLDREPDVERGDKKAFIFKLINANGGTFSTVPIALYNSLMSRGRACNLEQGYTGCCNIFLDSEKINHPYATHK